MKARFNTMIVILGIFFMSLSQLSIGQTGEYWSANEVMEPAALASILNNPKSAKPVIFNIGPLDNIKGATKIGSVNNKDNLNKLSKALANVPKDKMVIVYCGCCPFRNCPNVRPAFKMLKDMGFTKPRLLNLKQNLKVDWTDYGYPME